MYLINLTEHNKKFCLNFHYNGANSYVFVIAKEIHKFKAKDSEIVVTPICLRQISKDWSADNMKKTDFFYRIKIFIDLNKRKFVELYFNEQSRM